MDLHSTVFSFSGTGFVFNLFSVILIDLVLAGDNSVVIAMAVQSLPAKKRFQGILFGALAAVVLRVICAFFAAKLLFMPFVKLVGGMMILWIAIKLMKDSSKDEHAGKNIQTVWKAVWVILIADITMSLDNILAVAAASHGNLFLLMFGFGLSIPLVIFTSTLISKLMQRYPIIMWLGVLVLGKVGGEMCITDPIVVTYILDPINLSEIKDGIKHAHHYIVWGSELCAVAGVFSMCVLMRRKKKVVCDAPDPVRLNEN